MGVVEGMVLDMSGFVSKVVNSDIARRTLPRWTLWRVVCGVASPRGRGKPEGAQ